MTTTLRIEQIGDLRAILRYARRFRGDCFVLSIAGEVLVNKQAEALIVDLALLQSLGIRLVICFGLPDFVPMGQPVEATRLEQARREAGYLGQELSALFHKLGVRSSLCHVIEAIAFGKQAGVDQLRRGRVEQVDKKALEMRSHEDQVLLLPPLGMDSSGQFLWVSPQRIAAAVAQILQAAKWLELGKNLELSCLPAVHLPVRQAEEFAQSASLSMATLLRLAARACAAGVQRVHLLEADQEGALLAELFSPEGVGHMIHADEYGIIRPLSKTELPILINLLRHHMEDELILPRSEEQLAQMSNDFSVLDLDGSLVGCVALREFADNWGELAGLSIKPGHEGRGHGKRMVEQVMKQAQAKGYKHLFALTTNAKDYFEQVLGWQEARVEDLPKVRQAQLEESARNSWVFTYNLAS